MAKKERFLKDVFEKASTFQNLYLAFRKAFKSGKRSPDAQRFFFHLERELFLLQEEIRAGEYRPGNFYFFKVYDPKERTISVAPFRDRVVHHALVRILEPFYERIFINDSYATRKDKGSHRAIYRAQRFLRQYPWYLKMDIRKYFDSIDQSVLFKRIARRVKDTKMLEWIRKLIFLKEFRGFFRAYCA